ncbi:MAG TPA: A24 family peptidase [Acidimicrobiales bacterium]
MTALLVAGAGVTGLVVGGLLDPVGQREAERSAEEQDARGGDSGGQPVIEDAGRRPGRPPQVLPAGPSTARILGAALVTGGLFAGAADRFGAHLALVPYCAFFAVLVLVSTTDLSHGVIPRRLVYPAFGALVCLFVAVATADAEWHRLGSAAVGAAAAFAVVFVIWWLAPRGMGFGDVRLSALIGLATGRLGLMATYVALTSAFVVGLLFGIATAGLPRTGRTVRIPFAPALAAGAIVAVFWGVPIVQAVFHPTL